VLHSNGCPRESGGRTVQLFFAAYHAGGAEIAGNWPPGWAAYIGGALRHDGFWNLRFIDAMAFHIEDPSCSTSFAKSSPTS
jgi:anaerobic magnesium-protoporphyrin IX monomethyl ester cyclase